MPKRLQPKYTTHKHHQLSQVDQFRFDLVFFMSYQKNRKKKKNIAKKMTSFFLNIF